MSLWRGKAPRQPTVQFVKTQQEEGKTYHVYAGPDIAQALVFLRQELVKEPVVYVVVETPEGNIGRDFIYIFHESDGTPIEHGPRPPLPQPVRSKTHCAWCGFYVEAMEVPSRATDTTGTVKVHLTISEIRKNGFGYRCERCDLLQCPWCSGSVQDDATIRCRSCGQAMTSHIDRPTSVLPPPPPRTTTTTNTEAHWDHVRAYCEQWRDELAEADRNPADKLRWRIYVDGFKDGMVVTLSLDTPQGDVKSLKLEIHYGKLPLDVNEGREQLRKKITRLFHGLSIPLPKLP